MKENFSSPNRGKGGGSPIKDTTGDDGFHIASPGYRLFQAINDSAWEDVKRILKREPIQASGWSIRNNEVPDLVTSLGGLKSPTPPRHNHNHLHHQEGANVGNANDSSASSNTAWKRLPLHEALTRHPPVDAIDALLTAYPEGATYPDHQNRLPLQVACVHGASKQVIIKLLTSFPESISHRDSYGKTAAMSAEACPSFHDTIERNEIIEALCKTPTDWYIYKENERCSIEKEKEIEQIRKQFEKERDEFKAKNERIQKRAADERFEFFQMKEGLNLRIEELAVEKSQIARKMEALKQEKVDVRLELEGHIASREMELAVLRTELQDCKNSSAVLSKIDGMQQKLTAAIQRNNELEDEMAVLTKDAADFAVQLEEKAKCEAELQSYSQELFTELEEALKEKSQLELDLQVCKDERDTLLQTLEEEREDFKKTLKEERQTLHSKYEYEIDQLTSESDKKIFELESSLLETNMAKELLETTCAQDKILLTTKVSEMSRLSKLLSESRSKEHDLNEKLWALQIEIKVLQNEKEKEKRSSALANHNQRSDLKSKEAAEARWTQAEAARKNAESKRIEAEAERDSVKAEVLSLRQSEATLQRKVVRLEKEVANAKQTDSTSVESLTLTRERDSAKAEMLSLRQSEATLQKKIVHLEQEVAIAKRTESTYVESSTLTRERDSAKAELYRLRQSEAHLQQQIAYLEQEVANDKRIHPVSVESVTSTTPARKPVASKSTSPVSVVSSVNSLDTPKAETLISIKAKPPPVGAVTGENGSDSSSSAGTEEDQDEIDLDSLSPFERARLAFGKGKNTATKKKPVTRGKGPTRVTGRLPHNPITNTSTTSTSTARQSSQSDSFTRSQYEKEVRALQEAFASLEARMGSEVAKN